MARLRYPGSYTSKVSCIILFSIFLVYLIILLLTYISKIIINIIDRVGFKRQWKPLHRSELHLNHVPTEYKEITLPLSVFTKIWSRCTITHKHIYITKFYFLIPSRFKERLRLPSQLRPFKLWMGARLAKAPPQARQTPIVV